MKSHSYLSDLCVLIIVSVAFSLTAVVSNAFIESNEWARILAKEPQSLRMLIQTIVVDGFAVYGFFLRLKGAQKETQIATA